MNTETAAQLASLAEYSDDLSIDKMSELDNNNNAVSSSATAFLADAEHLKQMTSTQGWKIFKSFVETQISSHTAKLIQETKLEEIQRLQEYLKACHNLLQFPELTVSEASTFAESLSQQADLE